MKVNIFLGYVKIIIGMHLNIDRIQIEQKIKDVKNISSTKNINSVHVSNVRILAGD